MRLGVASVASHRGPIRDEADLLIEAVQDLAAAIAPVVAQLAEARARLLTAQVIEERRLVPWESAHDQPTAYEVLSAILRRLEEHAGRPQATATGAHDVARKVGVRLGVYDAESQPAFRRTRGQIEADREAAWLAAQDRSATRSAAQGRQK